MKGDGGTQVEREVDGWVGGTRMEEQNRQMGKGKGGKEERGEKTDGQRIRGLAMGGAG